MNLLDLGARCIRLFTNDAGIHRHLPPAVDPVAEAQDFAFHDRTAALLRGHIHTRQEDLADGETHLARLVPRRRHMLAEKIVRDLDMNTRAVAGFPIGIHGPPVPDRLQRIDPGHDNRAARHPVQCSDQPDATGIVFLGGVIRTAGLEAGRVADPVRDECRTSILGDFGHACTSLRSGVVRTPSAMSSRRDCPAPACALRYV